MVQHFKRKHFGNVVHKFVPVGSWHAALLPRYYRWGLCFARGTGVARVAHSTDGPLGAFAARVDDPHQRTPSISIDAVMLRGGI